MRKILKLINNEKKNLVVSISKGCSSELDHCNVDDRAYCDDGADYCGNYDYFSCTGGAVDDCRNIDNSACHEKHFDLCSQLDNTYCAEAEKYDIQG